MEIFRPLLKHFLNEKTLEDGVHHHPCLYQLCLEILNVRYKLHGFWAKAFFYSDLSRLSDIAVVENIFKGPRLQNLKHFQYYKYKACSFGFILNQTLCQKHSFPKNCLKVKINLGEEGGLVFRYRYSKWENEKYF